jgi:hypothetical protein
VAAGLQARSKERPTTTKGFFDYENFEQKVAEYLVLNPDGFARHPVEKIMEAMNVSFSTTFLIHVTEEPIVLFFVQSLPP